MEIAPAATLLATALGSAIGLMLGYFRGWFDDIVSRVIDAFLAIPGIILLIAVITSLGTSVPTLIITIGLAFTPIIARTVRAAVLAEAGQDYVQAAKLRGERAPYILFVEILPNIVPPIIVEATVRLGYAIFTLAGITFLGLGLQPPTPDWSVDITAGFSNLNDTSTTATTGRCSSPGSRSRRSASRSRCSPTACSRCSTDERRPTTASEQLGGAAAAPALEVRDLEVDYRVRGIWREVLRGISFSIERGTSYGLVGESGCGKSTAALTAIRYLPRNGRVRSGSVEVAASTCCAARRRSAALRGEVVSMVYQNPGTALNPSIRVGKQLGEVYTARGASRADAHDRSLAMLQQVQIASERSCGVGPGSRRAR